jgi:hypothetical protein
VAERSKRLPIITTVLLIQFSGASSLTALITAKPQKIPQNRKTRTAPQTYRKNAASSLMIMRMKMKKKKKMARRTTAALVFDKGV